MCDNKSLPSRVSSDRSWDDLLERFDFLRVSAEGGESLREPFVLFGFECGLGWYDLLEGLFEGLQELALEHGVSLAEALDVHQVKEKFGSLRVYVSFNGVSSEFFNQAYALIGEAEEKSVTVCELCGEDGYLRSDRLWIQTLCDKHAIKTRG